MVSCFFRVHIIFLPISIINPKYFVVFILNSHLLTFNCSLVFRQRFNFIYLFLKLDSGTIDINQNVINIS